MFDSTCGGVNRDLYIMNGDGYDMSRLTRGEADSIAGPWSPAPPGGGTGGTRIAYTTFGLTTSDIALINADGSGQVNLTNSPDVDEGFPAWSPDGTHIAFTTRRDGNNEIYVMNADGTNPAHWTDHPADDWAPTWSPDGTMIAFQTNRDGNWEIYLMAAAPLEGGTGGSGATNLTNDPADDQMPFWRP